MKKILTYFITIMLLLQLFCSTVAYARTHRNTAETTTNNGTSETTEAGVENQSTAPIDGETTTQEQTDNTTVIDNAVKTRILIIERDGKLAAQLFDENGYPLAEVIVYFSIPDNSVYAVTDENGYAITTLDMPPDGTYIYCRSDEVVINGVSYASAAASTGTNPTNTDGNVVTSNGETTSGTTINPTYNRSTKKTTARKTTKAPTWYTFAATTGMESSYVSLGFSFDSGILSAFKTDETKFRNTALLLLSPESYAQIVGDMKGTLFMTAAASAAEVTDEHIAAAIKDDPVLSIIEPKNVERVVMDIALKLESPTGKQTDMWTLAADSYVVQLPIPHNMRSAKAIAVAAVTADGISAPVYATVSKDGFLRFETTSPVGTIVLLGFKNSFLAAFSGDSAVLAITFLVIGVLCIGGAVFLYIYFFARPRRLKKKEQEAANEAEQNEEPTTEEEPLLEDLPPAEGNERIDPTDSLDIFTIDIPSEPTDKKPHSNIDIPL